MEESKSLQHLNTHIEPATQQISQNSKTSSQNSKNGSLISKRNSIKKLITPKLVRSKSPHRFQRLLIEKIELENFKSYGGLKVIGPLHKV